MTSSRMTGDVGGAARQDRAEHPPQEILVNVYETERAMVVVAPMPGITDSEVHVELQGRRLTISAELRTAAPKDYVRREFDYGSYHRTIDLPHAPGGAPITSLGNGLLAVTVPRVGAPPGPPGDPAPRAQDQRAADA
ncbi:MAG: Hsp20/alpha crystallin family protein [Acidimicrobiales bacterium]